MCISWDASRMKGSFPGLALLWLQSCGPGVSAAGRGSRNPPGAAAALREAAATSRFPPGRVGARSLLALPSALLLLLLLLPGDAPGPALRLPAGPRAEGGEGTRRRAGRAAAPSRAEPRRSERSRAAPQPLHGPDPQSSAAREERPRREAAAGECGVGTGGGAERIRRWEGARGWGSAVSAGVGTDISPGLTLCRDAHTRAPAPTDTHMRVCTKCHHRSRVLGAKAVPHAQIHAHTSTRTYSRAHCSRLHVHVHTSTCTHRHTAVLSQDPKPGKEWCCCSQTAVLFCGSPPPC